MDDLPALKRQHTIFALVPEHRLAIVVTPKAASTAIIKALLAHYDAEAERPYHRNACFAWMTLEQVNRYVPRYRRVMFVRNPFDRLVANYEFHVVRQNVQSSKNLRDIGIRPDMSFDQFLDVALRDPEADPHLALQCWQSDRVDFLGRFETLEADWSRMREWTGAALPDLEVANRTREPGDDYRRYYTDDMRARVERAYAHDLETYGYRF